MCVCVLSVPVCICVCVFVCSQSNLFIQLLHYIIHLKNVYFFQVKKKINVAYCVAKEELPFTKFRPLIVLCKKNGADITPSYDNHGRCAEMISTIANVMKSSLVEDIRSSRYVSVMIDGDTDSSNKECEMVYVRIIQDGKPTNRLVGQQEVENAHALGECRVIAILADWP